MVTCTGHIGIHEGADIRTDVHDVMAIKPNFLTSMGYHIFLTMSALLLEQIKYPQHLFFLIRLFPYCFQRNTALKTEK